MTTATTAPPGAGGDLLPVPQPHDAQSWERSDNEVVGFYCKVGHFNDPRVHFCSICGIAMAQITRVPVVGIRPQLGVLMLDDGTTFPLNGDHVFGREPGADSAVQAGRAQGVLLADSMVSRVHARVVLDGWLACVVDAGSANGTFLWDAVRSAWTRLPRGGTAPLRAGTVIALGPRQVRYHSHRNL